MPQCPADTFSDESPKRAGLMRSCQYSTPHVMEACMSPGVGYQRALGAVQHAQYTMHTMTILYRVSNCCVCCVQTHLPASTCLPQLSSACWQRPCASKPWRQPCCTGKHNAEGRQQQVHAAAQSVVQAHSHSTRTKSAAVSCRTRASCQTLYPMLQSASPPEQPWHNGVRCAGSSVRKLYCC